jgi:hypothetical protein
MPAIAAIASTFLRREFGQLAPARDWTGEITHVDTPQEEKLKITRSEMRAPQDR